MQTPRYRSIFWPLVLVAVGVLWLLSNLGLVAIVSPLAWLRFWPVLLIAGGLELLLSQRWPWAGQLIAAATVAILVLSVIFAPQLGLTGGLPWVPVRIGTQAAGPVVSQAREVSGFHAVDFSGYGELKITSGSTESLTLEGDAATLAEITTEVRGGQLHIGYAREGDWFVWPGALAPVKITLTVKQLDALTVSGAGNVVVQALAGDRLDLVMSGAGNVASQDLQLGDISVVVSGAGSVNTSGQAARQTVRLSGLGGYDGGALRTDSSTVTLSGAGSATVWATERLDAKVSGLGSISYFGAPSLDQSVSGLGAIRALGSK